MATATATPAMRSSEEILEQAARDGSIDISEWPRVLENMLQKLHDIVHNDFPLPRAPSPALPIEAVVDPAVIAASPPATQSSDPPAVQSQPEDASESLEPSSQGPENTNKENAPPARRPPVPSFSATSNATAPSTSSVQQAPVPDSPLPRDLLNSYQSSTNILRNSFGQSPPYTIQRLAELVLNPRRHYRFLPPFLSALDRAVSVTSAVNDFPLPQFMVSGSASFLTNGDSANGFGERDGLGSDESLGGALLTPIPWIKRHEEEALDVAANADVNGSQELIMEGEETIDGPHGAGRVETVSVTINGLSTTNTHHATPTGDGEGSEAAVAREQELRAQGAVTQGELLRQEQRAGVIPVGQEMPRHSLLAGAGAVAVGRDTASALTEEDGEPTEDMDDNVVEERPHARGPDVIGMEDTGPQTPDVAAGRPLDMEAAAGRKESPHSVSPHVEDAQKVPPTASIADKIEGDPVIVDGNTGGAADTATATDSVVGGEKRKRDNEDQGKANDEGDEDKEMTDAAS